jgi:hypothetical protein
LREGDPFPEQVRGWRMMIQPWVGDRRHRRIFADVFGGHSATRREQGPDDGDFGSSRNMGNHHPLRAARRRRSAAQAHSRAAPAEATYARVDIVVGNDGVLQIIELN